MDEFREVVTLLKRKVIGITESCSEGKSEGEWLTVSTMYIINNTDFESSVWSIITLNKKDILLI